MAAHVRAAPVTMERLVQEPNEMYTNQTDVQPRKGTLYSSDVISRKSETLIQPTCRFGIVGQSVHV